MAAEVPNLDIATIRLGGPVARGPGRCPRCRGQGCEPRPRRWPLWCWRRSRCWSRRRRPVPPRSPSTCRGPRRSRAGPRSSCRPARTTASPAATRCLRPRLKELGTDLRRHRPVLLAQRGLLPGLPAHHADLRLVAATSPATTRTCRSPTTRTRSSRATTPTPTRLARRQPRRGAAGPGCWPSTPPATAGQRHRRPAAGHERPHQPRPALRGGRGRAGRPGRLLAQARLRQGRGLPQPGHRGDAGRGGASGSTPRWTTPATRSGSATWRCSR